MTNETKLDLSRYRTDELASKIAEILSVPEAIRTVSKTTSFATIGLLIVNILLYVFVNNALTPWLLSSVYALLAAVPLGFILGLVRVAGRLIDRIEDLLKLTLQTSLAVSHDYQSIQSGEKELPSAADIVAHVYNGIILPIIESTVTNSLGFVGTPLLWVYRYTIGKGIRFLIVRMKTSLLSDDEQAGVEKKTGEVFQAVGGSITKIENTINAALGYTQYVIQMLRRLFLRPCQFLFADVVVVALIPLALCWYWM